MVFDPLAINPGELRHVIQIQAPDYGSEDARGKSAVPITWNKVIDTRAAILTAGGRETSMASQIVSQVSHVIKMRWTPRVIKAGYRVAFRDRFFTVNYVENVQERNRLMNLYCVEINGSAQ